MKIKPLPDTNVLNHFFDYCEATGILKWKTPSSKKTKVGDAAGSCDGSGYIVVNLHGKHYPVHRIAWKMVHGKDPDNLIDHINENRSDNRLSNLREAKHWQNLCNRGKNSNNTSGIKNICFDKSKGLWLGSLARNRKIVFCKYSKDITVVERALAEARKIHHLEFSKNE